MAFTASKATNELASILRGETRGLPPKVAALTAPEGIRLAAVTATEVIEGYMAAELVERNLAVKYPLFYLYCERITNRLQEKFRTFSGTAELAIEVRVSHEHIRDLHAQLHAYVQAVTDVLDAHRGTWAPGVFYTGGYEVTFQPVKHGGKNFIESAKVRLEVHVSVD